MKKFPLLFMLLAAIMLVTACGQNEKADKKTTETNHTKSVNGVEMKVEKLKLTEDGATKNHLLQIAMKFKNNNKTNFGIGAGDFKLKDADGKELKLKTEAPNFGDEIKSDKELTGNAYFIVPKTIKTAKLIYQPVTTVKSKKKETEVSWNLTLPELD
ncbi:DUF4352 domain-containing protein [Listeria sp. PSOL-1]|uniref:DUF4352 domain-containing protein n=1 Tax=Listeria sp. PSOL-1 TaxID=1844999 RepID=UPI0013D4D9E8|nr:DUF4352 domain-containing protein [Listeria sp. PSOL-1]